MAASNYFFVSILDVCQACASFFPANRSVLIQRATVEGKKRHQTGDVSIILPHGTLQQTHHGRNIMNTCRGKKCDLTKKVTCRPLQLESFIWSARSVIPAESYNEAKTDGKFLVVSPHKHSGCEVSCVLGASPSLTPSPLPPSVPLPIYALPPPHVLPLSLSFPPSPPLDGTRPGILRPAG